MAWVTLYGDHHFVVEFAQLQLEDRILEMHEFSTVRQGSHAVDVLELYGHLRRNEGGA